MNILIIAAHPDDEILGCGASMLKWSENGHDVHVLIMAEGATSRDERHNRTRFKKELSLLEKSAKKANKILGVKTLKLYDYPDNRIDSVDLLDVVKTIEKHISRLRPNVVVTHHSGDLNIDHQLIHQAVITACRPQPKHIVRRILTFEVPSATEWQSPTVGNPFIPNWFEDISETIKSRLCKFMIPKCGNGHMPDL